MTSPVSPPESAAADEQAAELARLTGVRSGKRSYYLEFVRSDERMQRTVHALDSISRALLRTTHDPHAIMVDIARAALAQLSGRWSLLALQDETLPWSPLRTVAVSADGTSHDPDQLPSYARAELDAARARTTPGFADDRRWVRVPMRIEGVVVGGLSVLHGLDGWPDPGDLSLLRILANQAAVALRTAELYHEGLDLRRRAEQLYEKVAASSRALAQSTSELRETREQLVAADQRALVDSERHRIARELHDSVSQLVLSAGLAVDIARLDSADLGPQARHVTAQLDQAKQLSQDAVRQLRDAIYSLNHSERASGPATLGDLLEEMAAGYRPRLAIRVRVEADSGSLDARGEHELARIAGEALFNVAAHSGATRVDVRLARVPQGISLSVSDDGGGDPAVLRRLLRAEHGSGSVPHRGLANMAARAEGIGARLSIRRSRWGGITLRVTVPPRDATPSRDARGMS